MSVFVPTLKRLVETASVKISPKTLLNITTKSSLEEVSYLDRFQEFELGWSVKTLGMFDIEIINKNLEYIRWISNPMPVTYEIDDGTTIQAGSVKQFINSRKVDILAFDCDDGITNAIDGFPFEDVIAERILVNTFSCDYPSIKKQLNNYGYEHVDSGIFVPSSNVVSKFMPIVRRKQYTRGHTRIE